MKNRMIHKAGLYHFQIFSNIFKYFQYFDLPKTPSIKVVLGPHPAALPGSRLGAAACVLGGGIYVIGGKGGGRVLDSVERLERLDNRCRGGV